MNKKLITIIAIIGIAALLFFGYNTFLAPKGVEGSKEVTIQIVADSESIEETFTYKTDHEFLYDLLEEQQEELGASFETFDFGTMVAGLMNYTADASSEYFHLTVNGKDAMTGPQEVPLNDQDVYKFELRNY